MRIARLALLLLATLLLAACATPAPTPAPSQTAAPSVVVALPTLLATPQQWSGQLVTLIAPLSQADERRVLTGPQSAASQGVWLAQPLPADVLEAVGSGPAFVGVRGTLSPPGAYGSDQRYTYQFAADRAMALTPERTRLDNLALNPGALDRVLLRLDGTLLARPDGALLVDKASAGGVPAADASQIKLPAALVDQALTAPLKTAGDVRWGPVEVIGWWQQGSLTPLAITAPAAQPSATAEPGG